MRSEKRSPDSKEKLGRQEAAELLGRRRFRMRSGGVDLLRGTSPRAPRRKIQRARTRCCSSRPLSVPSDPEPSETMFPFEGFSLACRCAVRVDPGLRFLS